MRFQCPFCRGIVAVENSDMGSDVQCGHCGEVVTVPYSRLATGAVIADFIILEELGRGGMGIVYLAHQISLDRPAAVKILADSYANNAEFVVNFIKEARSAAKLNHPHIVQAYAVGEDEGVFFFAMEHIDGETMKHVLRRDKVINVEKCITIIQQISEALDYAWKEAKLIHRDIKPDNIMLTKNGRAKLADLGLSKVAGDTDDSDSDEVMGTPQYISPEHLTGAPMDVRSDIYSLGATFYHLITGRFPFEGRTATEIARKHLEEPLTPPHVINAEIPIAVGQIIEKMMAKNIKGRYQDAEQLVDDLRMVRRGKRPPTATQGVKAAPGQTKLGVKVTATRRQLQTQLKTINMHLTGMMGKTQTGTIADLDSLASLELKRQHRKKWFFTLAIILIVGVGVYLLLDMFVLNKTEVNRIQGVKTSLKGEGKQPQKEKSAKLRPSSSPYARRVKKIITFYKRNPGKKDDFLSRVDDFLEAYPKPQTQFEKDSLYKLLAIYVPLDESIRVTPKRDQYEEKYFQDLEKATLERQRILEERKRIAREKKLKLERELAEQRKRNSAEAKRERKAKKYAASLNAQKIVLRRKMGEYAANKNFSSLKELFNKAIKEPEGLPSDSVATEIEAAGSLSRWAQTMEKGMLKGISLYDLIYNGGKKLAGISVEVNGELVKVESINNGIVDVKSLTGGDIDTIKMNRLPSKVRRIIVKKAIQEMDDDNAVFFYNLIRGAFSRKTKAMAPSKEWSKEYSQFVCNYFKSKLKNASSREKDELERKYGSMSEYKKAVN